jgi:hypothetical protein
MRVGRLNQCVVDRQAGLAKRLMVATVAFDKRLVLLRPQDHGDPPVAQPDQMLCGQVGARLIVGDDAVDMPRQAVIVDGHQRDLLVGQAVQQLVGDIAPADRQQPSHMLLGHSARQPALCLVEDA